MPWENSKMHKSFSGYLNTFIAYRKGSGNGFRARKPCSLYSSESISQSGLSIPLLKTCRSRENSKEAHLFREREEKQQFLSSPACQVESWLIYSLDSTCSTCPFYNRIHIQLKSRRLYLLAVFVGAFSRIGSISSCYILTCHRSSILFLRP